MPNTFTKTECGQTAEDTRSVFQVSATLHTDFLGFILTLLFPNGSKKLYGFFKVITYSTSDFDGRSFCKSVRTLQFPVTLLVSYTVTAVTRFMIRSYVIIGK